MGKQGKGLITHMSMLRSWFKYSRPCHVEPSLSTHYAGIFSYADWTEKLISGGREGGLLQCQESQAVVQLKITYDPNVLNDV